MPRSSVFLTLDWPKDHNERENHTPDTHQFKEEAGLAPDGREGNKTNVLKKGKPEVKKQVHESLCDPVKSNSDGLTKPRRASHHYHHHHCYCHRHLYHLEHKQLKQGGSEAAHGDVSKGRRKEHTYSGTFNEIDPKPSKGQCESGSKDLSINESMRRKTSSGGGGGSSKRRGGGGGSRNAVSREDLRDGKMSRNSVSKVKQKKHTQAELENTKEKNDDKSCTSGAKQSTSAAGHSCSSSLPVDTKQATNKKSVERNSLALHSSSTVGKKSSNGKSSERNNVALYSPLSADSKQTSNAKSSGGRNSLALQSPSGKRNSLALQSPSSERNSLALQSPSSERNSLALQSPLTSVGANSVDSCAITTSAINSSANILSNTKVKSTISDGTSLPFTTPITSASVTKGLRNGSDSKQVAVSSVICSSAVTTGCNTTVSVTVCDTSVTSANISCVTTTNVNTNPLVPSVISPSNDQVESVIKEAPSSATAVTSCPDPHHHTKTSSSLQSSSPSPPNTPCIVTPVMLSAAECHTPTLVTIQPSQPKTSLSSTPKDPNLTSYSIPPATLASSSPSQQRCIPFPVCKPNHLRRCLSDTQLNGRAINVAPVTTPPTLALVPYREPEAHPSVSPSQPWGAGLQQPPCHYSLHPAHQSPSSCCNIVSPPQVTPPCLPPSQWYPDGALLPPPSPHTSSFSPCSCFFLPSQHPSPSVSKGSPAQTRCQFSTSYVSCQDPHITPYDEYNFGSEANLEQEYHETHGGAPLPPARGQLLEDSETEDLMTSSSPPPPSSFYRRLSVSLQSSRRSSLWRGCCHYPQPPASPDYYDTRERRRVARDVSSDAWQRASPSASPFCINEYHQQQHSLHCTKPDLLHMEACLPSYSSCIVPSTPPPVAQLHYNQHHNPYTAVVNQGYNQFQNQSMFACSQPLSHHTPSNLQHHPVMRSKSYDSAVAAALQHQRTFHPGSRWTREWSPTSEHSNTTSRSGTAYDSVNVSTNPSTIGSDYEEEDEEAVTSFTEDDEEGKRGGEEEFGSSTLERKKRVTFQLPPKQWTGYNASVSEECCGYPTSGYAELDRTLAPPPGQDPYHGATSPSPAALHSAQGTLDRYGHPQPSQVRWRDPDLHEVIDFLSNPNNVVKANAAAYLQHLCYMDDTTKQKTRILGGIPPLVSLLSNDVIDLHRNACGALRNLSYGRQNDENKRAIKDSNGIPSLIRLLKKTRDNEVRELVTGILWNLSSCEELKTNILEDGVSVLVSHVIVPASGWDGGEVERDPNNDVWWNTVFKNASGVLRNVSSAGEHARTRLRHCHGLIDALLAVIKSAIHGNSHDNKCVENCVCILRNLSYRCQEVEDPNYDKNQPVVQTRATATAKGDNLGCFGGSRNKKKDGTAGSSSSVDGVAGASSGTLGSSGASRSTSTGLRTDPPRGMELLWQPDVVVQPYLSLLSECSNPETLEAAAGAIQNLAACYWQPSVEVRAAVRKEKGLPILVELLRMEVDRVVCAVATALRNLAIDQRNKELIGKYAMRDLVQKLPTAQSGRSEATASDETIAAVLATLNEVIKKNTEFSRALLDCDGVERLVYMTRNKGRYTHRVLKFASQVLYSMWAHQELREVYKRAGWKEIDFVSKSVSARSSGNGAAAGSNSVGGGSHSPTANNTLSRPMASQGGTRYEDRTLHRNNQARHHAHHHQQPYIRGEEVPLANMGYGGDDHLAENVRLYGPPQGQGGGREPVYAKVNRDKKQQQHHLHPHQHPQRRYDSTDIYGTAQAHDTTAVASSSPSLNNNNNMDDWSGPGYASVSNNNSNGWVAREASHSTAASLLNSPGSGVAGGGYGSTCLNNIRGESDGCAGGETAAGENGGGAGDSWV